MTQPSLDAGITSTPPSRWVWYVSLNGKRVGTVNGHDVVGFIDGRIDHESIGGFVTVEAAKQTPVPGAGRPA